MASLLNTAVKFILVKPAENCTKDSLRIGPQLEKTTMPVLDHFSNVCPDMDYIKITPLEHVL